ncbi:DUF1627 domain-containing protein [Buttiauxella sp. 3AFRM03]|uniref:DUF1627 domain-containing protein n=1 Tax=Buttiauxella sp. 3AFRM03 TaxID=2479367 RepID=UPI000EF7BF58|nr:DUF1627 domain-containing protein [Buttiauxella sp. 3AFRM03]AYN29977.1 DUF1627 domain-containing protein [Buttiauxella sp. 3AFRM03]
METILEVLKKMEKATAREMAARMKIDAPDALAMLRDHEDRGEVNQVNGYWQLTGRASKKPANAVPKKTKPPASKINEAVLVKLLHEHGAMTSEQLAKLADTTVRTVASTLAMPVNKGRIVREKRGNVFHFNVVSKTALGASKLPESASKPAIPVTETPKTASIPEKTETPAPQSSTAFVDTIPQLVSTNGQPAALTPKIIAGEIRKTKSRLVQLEKLRVTVRTQTRLQRSLGL